MPNKHDSQTSGGRVANPAFLRECDGSSLRWISRQGGAAAAAADNEMRLRDVLRPLQWFAEEVERLDTLQECPRCGYLWPMYGDTGLCKECHLDRLSGG
jgi:hypothetical protein